MAYKLQIVDPQGAINFNTRYSNLAKAKRPEVIAKAPNGKQVKEKNYVKSTGQILQPGETGRKWIDDDGNEYSKGELQFFVDNEQVEEVSQTKVFEIEGYQPLSNYTDRYVIASYYEIWPDDNGMKKDIDKNAAIKANLYQMKKLWDKLTNKGVVARGEFCVSSKGFIASDGYIRAICMDGNKWGLEIGLFKEEKVFEHLQEGEPEQAEFIKPVSKKGKKLKRV